MKRANIDELCLFVKVVASSILSFAVWLLLCELKMNYFQPVGFPGSLSLFRLFSAVRST